MKDVKILFLDEAHPIIVDGLTKFGVHCFIDNKTSKEELINQLSEYEGIIVRSRFTIDKEFISAGKNLKFIARIGAGVENIDCDFAFSKGIKLISSPQGNRQAVGEHALGMLLALFNNILRADNQVRNGIWQREENRGMEVCGKTIGIIGYGNMGRSFARCVSGLSPEEVICYDILDNVGDNFARQVSLDEFFEKCDIVSLHTPQTSLTIKMINSKFLDSFKKNIFLINTARGSAVVTQDLADKLKEGKVLGAALDVLEYENSSFENIFSDKNLPQALDYIIKSDKTILSPHIAGWSLESRDKMATIILNKILEFYSHNC